MSKIVNRARGWAGATVVAAVLALAGAREAGAAGTLGSLQVTPSVSQPGQAVTLTVSGQGSCTVLVNFGDGTAKTLKAGFPLVTTHVFALAGSYKVTVEGGTPAKPTWPPTCSGAPLNRLVKVQSAPPPKPTATPTKAASPQPTATPTAGPGAGSPGGASRFDRAVAPAPALVGALSTPTPRPSRGLGAAAIVRPPVSLALSGLGLSPDRLDFPALWNGQKATKTVVLHALADGQVAAGLPDGSFRIGEMRVMGAGYQPVSRNLLLRNVAARVTAAPWQIQSKAGDEVQVDVIFEPKFDLFSNAAGPKSATLALKGPGTQGAWSVDVPVQGDFNGLQIGVTLLLKDRELFAFPGDAQATATARLVGLTTPVNGTLHGGKMPAGVSAPSMEVSVPANQTIEVTVPLSLTWGGGGLPSDGKPEDFELVFDAGGRSATAGGSISPLPMSVTGMTDPTYRTDCGVGRLWVQFSATVLSDRSGMNVWISSEGFNKDLVNGRNVYVEVDAGTVPVQFASFNVPNQPNPFGSDQIGDWKNTYFASFSTPSNLDAYVNLVQGNARIGCGLSDGLIAMPPPYVMPWQAQGGFFKR